MLAFACINEQRGAGEVTFASGMQLRKNGNQLDGKVIHAVKAHVLEGVEDGTFSRTGKSGEDDELSCVLSGLRFHGW